jgi:hypothetical protein
VAAHSEMTYTLLMASSPRHAARSPGSPAHPAGAAPLSPGRAPAAERRVVRPLRPFSNEKAFPQGA